MPRNNNFDLLRMVFASMVVLYHCHDLSLNPSYFWIPYVTSSRLAVEGFFAMSGCLIVGSYDRSPALGSYLEKRARRLLPAYWAALLFTLILALLMSRLSVPVLLRSTSTYAYILANLTFLNFLHPVLPGLFVHNPVLPAVNGALWTIKVEVMFYLLVPAIVACGRRFGHCQTLSGIFVLSVGYRVIFSQLHHPSMALQLPGQLCFFVIGSLTYHYYPWFRRRRHWMWTVALVSYLLSLYLGWIAFRAIGVGLGVMCLGLLLPCLRGPTKYGDFSYGTYVFHFPVIQAFISRGIVNAVPFVALGLICLTTGCLAIASWFLVERPWLHPAPRKQPGRPLQSLEWFEASKSFDAKET
jgi:peptidoglycan/LPS O-acetylase OafA/YrhL